MTTEDRRSLTSAEIEEIITRQKRAEISAQRAAILHGMELKLVELIGTDGDGGEFSTLRERVHRMEADMATQKIKLADAELFINKVKWTIGLTSVGGGVVTALTVWIIERMLGR